MTKLELAMAIMEMTRPDLPFGDLRDRAKKLTRAYGKDSLQNRYDFLKNKKGEDK
jgi:hypothetical protein